MGKRGADRKGEMGARKAILRRKGILVDRGRIKSIMTY